MGGTSSTWSSSYDYATIGNGDVILGVGAAGELNVPYDGSILGLPASDPLGVDHTGLRTGANTGEPGQYSATEKGSISEGWGLGIPALGISSYANNWASLSDPVNMNVMEFSGISGGATAYSKVQHTSGAYQVEHSYYPSTSTDYAMECTVTITNTGDTAFPSTLYRRVMDWDIDPTPFNEYVTIQGWGSSSLIATTNYGFASNDPLVATSPVCGAPANTDLTDFGPCDQGAQFDFDFGALDPDESVSFKIFYGVTESSVLADVALNAIGAEVYSKGKSSTGVAEGTPYTFFFAFTGVGGDPFHFDSGNYYYFNDGSSSWTWEEAQNHCQSEHGTDLATLTDRDDFFEAIALIDDGPSPWIGLYSSKDIGWWEWIDSTECSEDIKYSGMCIEGKYWWEGAPTLCEPCADGSECGRLKNGKAANDVQCDNKLSAILCNKESSDIEDAKTALIFNLDNTLNNMSPAENKMAMFFGILSGVILIGIVLQCIFWSCGCKNKKHYSSISVKEIEDP